MILNRFPFLPAALCCLLTAAKAADNAPAGAVESLPPPAPKQIDYPKDKLDFWTFKPLAHPALPKVRRPSWARNPIDHFVLARLEQEQLAPAPEASPVPLIRRLSFDLTGLPPTPEEVEAFLKDKSPRAYETLVDRLLVSPRYGERWGRHWLDVVHYGETHGYDKDKLRPNAWPYRDYVIRSLNDDKPYPRFVQEQIAGDALFPGEPEAVVATGFLAAGPWDFVGHVELPESKTDGLIARSNDRDDMVMTTMSTFQSLTVHCARCHDHKFDPISQRDYYRLQAVFAGVDRADRFFDSDPAIFARRKTLLADKAVWQEKEKRLSSLRDALSNDQIREWDERLKSLKAQLPSSDPGGAAQKKETEDQIHQIEQDRRAAIDALFDPGLKAELAEITNHLGGVDRELAALPPAQWVYAAANDFPVSGSFLPAKAPRPIHLLQRGDVRKPQEVVEPGALGCLSGLKADFAEPGMDREGNRRAALARWLTDPGNFLTRRSIVNRVWQYHFGRGLVDTPNDFGHMGSRPSHPELLDWLAGWFMENGESLKRLHRLIVTSATYRQAAVSDRGFEAIDSDNRYLWRMNRRRLEAEEFRDGILLVSGKLDLTMGGPSQRQFRFKDDHSPVYDYTGFDQANPASFRRSIYRHIVRSVPDPFLDCLDAADPSLLTAKRNVTLTALQALATLNDPFVLRQARYFADRLERSSPDLAAQLDLGCRLVWSRHPTSRESEALQAYSRKYGIENCCRLLFNSNEFLFVD